MNSILNLKIKINCISCSGGIYKLEINTNIYKELWPTEDVVNGGPFNNGTYNFTINIHYTFSGFEINYLQTSFEIWLHILPIPTILKIEKIEQHSINGVFKELTGPIFPYEVPGSFYFFKLFLNYSTTNGTTLDSINYHSLKIWNGSYWKSWEPGKYQVTPGILHELKIYTFTFDTEQISWNRTGFKNITLSIEFRKTNYENQTLIQTIWFRKHNTIIQWCDPVTEDPIPSKINETINNSIQTYTIFFRFIDLDNINDSISTYSGSPKYITYAELNFTGWNRNWALILETVTPGFYELILQINYPQGIYNITIFANDTHPSAFRNCSYFTIQIVIISLTHTPFDPSLILLYLVGNNKPNLLIPFIGVELMSSIILAVFSFVIYRKRYIKTKKEPFQSRKLSNMKDPSIIILNTSQKSEISPKFTDSYRKIDLYGKIIEINPQNAVAWEKLGVAYKNLEDYQNAIICFEKITKINPAQISSWICLGKLYGKLHKYNEAIKCYQKIIELDPQNLQAKIIIAALKDKLKDN